MRISFLINNLEAGGAQRVLANLVENMPNHEIQVIVLQSPGHFSERVERAAHLVTYLHIQNNQRNLAKISKTVGDELQRFKPHVVNSHLLQSDLVLATVNASLSFRRITSIHTSSTPFFGNPKSWLAALAVSVLSKRFDLAIACGGASAKYCRRWNYKCKQTTIENGSFFGGQIARELPASPTLLNIARWDAAKGHRYLFSAISKVADEFPDVRLVCLGEGMTADNKPLAKILHRLGLQDRVKLLGIREDTESWMLKTSALVVSSISEALPMVVIEASLLRLPVITTAVGDCASFGTHESFICRPGDSESLAESLRQFLRTPPGMLSSELESRFQRSLLEHSLEGMVQKYERALKSGDQ